MPGKLFIYDEEDEDQADDRFDSDDVTALAVGSTEELLAALDRLVASHATFDRVLFQTHGASGVIKFGDHHVYDITLTGRFAGRRYHTLFPWYTRIYFDGCNVAVGSEGDKFLTAAGNVFLRISGGETFGWTSYGYGYSGWVPFIGGHTIHFTGEVKKFHFSPGGILIPEAPTPKVNNYPGGGDYGGVM